MHGHIDGIRPRFAARAVAYSACWHPEPRRRWRAMRAATIPPDGSPWRTCHSLPIPQKLRPMSSERPPLHQDIDPQAALAAGTSQGVDSRLAAGGLARVLQELVDSMLVFDRSKISSQMAVRNTLGFIIPLALCIAFNQPALASVVGFATLMIAISDKAGNDLTKAPRLLAATLASTIAIVAGGMVAEIPWLIVPVIACWGFSAGMLAALGPGSLQVGAVSILLFMIATAHPHAVFSSLELGGFVLAAGLFQTFLALVRWPLFPQSTERRAIATVLDTLSRNAANPGTFSPTGDAPATTALLEASRPLRGHGGQDDPSRRPDVDQRLLTMAQRIQVTLLAVAHSPNDGRSTPDPTIVGLVASILNAGSLLLADATTSLTSGRTPLSLQGRLTDLDRVLAQLAALRDRQFPTSPSPESSSSSVEEHEAARLAMALLQHCLLVFRTELAHLVELLLDPEIRSARRLSLRQIRVASRIRLMEGRTTLRANLTFQSTTFRHALRLAICLALAETIVLLFSLDHGYWAPMAVAIILRPEFSLTFSRGIGRLVGTAFGLLVGTTIILAIEPGLWGHVVLMAVIAFVFRLVSPANNILATLIVTTYTVTLLSLSGMAPETAIIDRSVSTLIGGVIALGIFLIWPTWEQRHVSSSLGLMFSSFRTTVRIVMEEHLHPGTTSPALIQDLRIASRLARSNAAACVERIKHEPHADPARYAMASDLVSRTRQLTFSILTMESYLQESEALATSASRVSVRTSLERFLDAVDSTFVWLEESLQADNPTHPARLSHSYHPAHPAPLGHRVALPHQERDPVSDLNAATGALREQVRSAGRRDPNGLGEVSVADEDVALTDLAAAMEAEEIASNLAGMVDLMRQGTGLGQNASLPAPSQLAPAEEHAFAN